VKLWPKLIVIGINAVVVLGAAKIITGEFVPNGTLVLIAFVMMTVSSWGIERLFTALR